MNRRGWIHFRAHGMRRSHKANFRVTRVNEDHVQIIDEDEQDAWYALVQSAAYRADLKELLDAVQRAQLASEHCEMMYEQRLCKQSKVATAAKRVRAAKAAMHSFRTPKYFCDVPYDSIYSFRFAIEDGLSIMY